VAHFLTALAGPLVSLAIWAGAWFGETHTPRWWSYALRYVAQLNLAIVLFNLLPAIPLDGGRMLQALLWRQMGYARSMWICVHLAIVAAVILFFYSLGGFGNAHISLLSSGVALFIFFEAVNERRLLAVESTNEEYWESRPGIAWNHPYNDAKTRTSVPHRFGFVGWWKKLIAGGFRKTKSADDFLREEIDPILDKISREGMQSLTSRERKILESARDLLQKRQR
jgi:hypothetical protein